MGQASFPQLYERWLVGPLFQPFAEAVLDEIGLAAGDRLLDIACGTGIVARVARRRLGEAAITVGVDLNADMLAVARGIAGDIDWRQGNAEALPLREGEAFDVVVCQQGLQFFPDKRKAVAEMRRALAQGGRLAVVTWHSDEEFPLLRELRRVAERHLGAIADRRHGFGDAAPIEALVRAAGFHDIRSRTIARTVRFDTDAPFLRLNALALVGMSDAAKDLAKPERGRIIDAIVSASTPVLEPYVNNAGFAFELSSNLTTARG